MPTYYKHTQFGTLTVSIIVAAIILFSLLGFIYRWHLMGIGVLFILLICLILFHSLTVEISDGHMEIRFGIGLIKKRFDLKDIIKAYTVRNHWYYGWGIRIIPRGWLFNVSGLDAIEIVMSSGKRYRIGTDQPDELSQTINETIKIIKPQK